VSPGGRAPSGRTTVVREWARKYWLAAPYSRESQLDVVAEDGVRLRAHRLSPADPAIASVVLVHGFAGWSRGPAMREFADHLVAEGLEVVLPDLRGHGQSSGRSTIGVDEPKDVEAALRATTQALKLTVGVSLGAAACLLHAGTYGGVDGVVAISAPARWRGDGHRAASHRVGWLANTRRGRAVMSAFVRTRVAPKRPLPRDPVEVVGRVAPATTVIVHDPDDHYFDASHAHHLYDSAGDPRQLWWYEGRGHGVDLFDPALAARIGELARTLAAGESAGGVELLGHEEAPGPLGAGVAGDQLPEAGGVGRLDQVGHLVDDDVIDHPVGISDQDR
jgi:pimeloyl-ACP methyl ester carboxylesterase